MLKISTEILDTSLLYVSKAFNFKPYHSPYFINQSINFIKLTNCQLVFDLQMKFSHGLDSETLCQVLTEQIFMAESRTPRSI